MKHTLYHARMRRTLQLAYCYILAYGHEQEFKHFQEVIGSAELITPSRAFPMLEGLDTLPQSPRHRKRRRREFTRHGHSRD